MLRNLSSRSNCGHTGLVLELWIKLPNGGFNLANIFRMQIYRQHSFPMATAWKAFPSTFIGGKNNGCRHGKLQLNHQMEKQRVGRAVIELFNGVCKSPIQGQNKSSDISSVYRSCNWLQLLCIDRRCLCGVNAQQARQNFLRTMADVGFATGTDKTANLHNGCCLNSVSGALLG